MIPEYIREEFKELSKTSSHRESGAYFMDGKLHPLINVSPDPNQFEVDLESTKLINYSRQVGKSIVLLHSHINSNDDFSVQDIILSKAWKLPIYLYNLSSGVEKFYDPEFIAPYEGRSWSYTTANCYTLIQDFYNKEFNIKLKDFYLDNPLEFKDPKFNKFLLNIQTQGFIQLREEDEIKKGDLILFNMDGYNPNHIGVMFDVEGNKFLHQLCDRFSRLSPYCRDYRRLTHSIYRHQKLL
jgi:proteasome lid subunit RPN8/RPN11